MHNDDVEWMSGKPPRHIYGIYEFTDQLIKAHFDLDLIYVGSSGSGIQNRLNQHIKESYSGDRLKQRLLSYDNVRWLSLPFPKDDLGLTKIDYFALTAVEQIRIWQHGGVETLANSYKVMKALGGFTLERYIT